jgi:DNA-binding SARP family transcriptional activator
VAPGCVGATGLSWYFQAEGVPRLWRGATPGAGGVPEPPQTVTLIDRDAGLLAYLALEGASPAAELARLLWPSRSEKQALNNLRQRLHKLRRSTGARLLETGPTLRLASDLTRQAAEHGDEAEPAALNRLLDPCDFADCPDFADWLSQRRAEQAAAHAEQLAQAAAAAERDGDWDRALRCAQRLLSLEPLSEAPYRLSMRLHYLRGDVAAAMKVWRDCERMLRDEYDAVPSAETTATAELVRRAAQGRQTAQGPQALPLALLRPPRMVGRDDEARRLREAVQARLTGIVRGEPGMGKSRLLQELVAERPSAVYLQARPGDLRSPYATTTRVLQALVPRLPAQALLHNPAVHLLHGTPVVPSQGPSAASLPQLLKGLTALLQAAAAGGVDLVVLDDLHYADPASEELLEALMGSMPSAAPTWVLAQRPLAPATEAGRLTAALLEQGAARVIDVQPLEGAVLDEFVGSLALDRSVNAAHLQQLGRHTGGNPLFILETLRGLVATPPPEGEALPTPDSVHELIRARLARLSPTALALARVAALAVPDFSTELAAEVMATPALALADAWAELEAAQVLRGEGFAHDLVQDAARGITPEPIARNTHQRIATHLARVGADPARLALHWERAGQPQAAMTQYEQAAQWANMRGRLREAAELLVQAADQAERATERDHAYRLRARAVGRLIQSQGPSAAQPLVARMLAQATTLTQQALAQTSSATLHLWAGQNDEADAAARSALAVANDDIDRCPAARVLAMSLRQRGRPQDALAVLQAWAGRTDVWADAEEQASFAADYTTLLISNERLPEALVSADEQLRLAQALNDSQTIATALINQCVVKATIGDLAGAVSHAQAVDTLLLDEAQSATLKGMNCIQLGYLLGATGRFREAQQHLDAGTASFSIERMPWVHAVASNARARLYAWLGQRARALQQLREAVPNATVAVRITRLHLLAELTGWATRESSAWLDEAASLASQAGLIGQSVITRMHQLRAAGASERLQAWPALETKAQSAGYQWLVALLQLQRLEDGLAQGQAEVAAHELPAVAALTRRLSGPTVYAPETLLRVAEAAHACGETPLRDELLAEAARWVAEAEQHCPPEFHDSFLQRNPTNVRLRAARQRWAPR